MYFIISYLEYNFTGRCLCASSLNYVFCLQGPPQPGQPIKFTVGESCDRIKEEFNFLQAQYHKSV